MLIRGSIVREFGIALAINVHSSEILRRCEECRAAGFHKWPWTGTGVGEDTDAISYVRLQQTENEGSISHAFVWVTGIRDIHPVESFLLAALRGDKRWRDSIRDQLNSCILNGIIYDETVSVNLPGA